MIKNHERDSYKWIVLGISFSLMLVFAISLQSLPPIFGNIMKDIPFSNKQAGLLISVYSIIGIFFPFFVAFSAEKLDIKMTIIVALSLVIMGLVGFSFSTSFTMLLLFRLLSGAGATVLVVLAPLLITMYFGKEKMGSAMGIFNTAVPLGTVISVNLFGYLGIVMDWRLIIRLIIGFVAIVLLAVSLFLVVPKRQVEKDSNKPTVKFNLSSSLIFLGMIWMITNGQLLAYTTFGSQFYDGFSLSPQKSSLLTSMIMLVPIFITPIIGIIIDKTGQKKRLLFLGLSIMTIAFFGIVTSWLPLTFWAIALGGGFAFVPVVVFSLLPELIKPEHTSFGLALLTTSSNLGIAIGPMGFGSLLDATSGNFMVGFRVLSVFSIVSILAVSRIRKRHS